MSILVDDDMGGQENIVKCEADFKFQWQTFHLFTKAAAHTRGGDSTILTLFASTPYFPVTSTFREATLLFKWK